ncbi:hypothetical protein [Zestomonas carbonaria]|uniref:Uncharacterized protein n=1 Tax=Zestomonas carbonaria TaxID=2762745 RepID=A0A7U7IB52_9GAMM|nr:hypothetical protein [Pseudomonas carbonaria]CAD5109566.1 hypothetical protein PSEWESI4_03871 [Pseudomonas carbonaria]
MPFIIGFLRTIVSVVFKRLSAWLVGLFTALAGPLISAFLKLFSRLGKVALVIAAITLAVGLFTGAVDLVFGQIASNAPDDLVAIGRMLLPGNLSICIGILVLVRVKALIFFWVVRLSEKFENA